MEVTTEWVPVCLENTARRRKEEQKPLPQTTQSFTEEDTEGIEKKIGGNSKEHALRVQDATTK
jgi:hypothetical protein